MEKPLVSVIVPTFKRADRLCGALESIARQTYSNLEILVVNDNIPGSAYDIEGESSEQVQRLVVVDLPGALPLETLAWSPVE